MGDNGNRPTTFARTSQTFITGVIGILPLALTFAVFAWTVVFLHDLAGPQSAFGNLLRHFGMSVTACEVTAYLLGLIGTMLLVYGLGLLVESGAASRWNSTLDRALQRVPVISTVYDASKNLTNLFNGRADTPQGMTPVMCYFSSDFSIATPALLPTSQKVYIDGIGYYVVIIPSAPVPFGGALLCVRSELVKPANCTIDELVGVYMSMGTSAPACLSSDRSGETAHLPPTTSPGEFGQARHPQTQDEESTSHG
jgi:uncharacterized membrane protein